MDAEIPVLTGYLIVPSQSGFSLNRISKKKSCHKYCLLFRSSRHGIERLEICETKDDKNPKIITLENCVKITQEPSPANLIQIVKKTGALTLNTLTEDDLKEWVNALQLVAFHNKNVIHGSHAIEEDNDLYCSSFGDGMFIITLIPSETSIRCNIEPKAYLLHLTTTELQLKSSDESNAVIAKWPYRFIRKYGYRDGKFTFEAGRKCSTGEGVFTLDHTSPQEIFRCMSSKMKSMKKLISGDNISGIDTAENQLNAAASMEAGSRSPLPPSSFNQNLCDFEINTPSSCVSLREFISSNDSLNNLSTNQASASTSSQVKVIPNKPPRKLPLPAEKQHFAVHSQSDHISNCDKTRNFQNYEPVSITSSTDSNKIVGSTVVLKPSSPEIIRKQNNTSDKAFYIGGEKPEIERDYESIETITDAWKTLGVDDIKHTERIAACENEDDYMESSWQRSIHRERSANKDSLVLITKATKIIDIDIGEGTTVNSSLGVSDSAYDRLDFLCPNNTASSGYKTIVNVNSENRFLCNPSLNDYELIASPDTQPYRRADDTHLGYGVLRKSVTGSMIPTSTTTTTLNSNIAITPSFVPATTTITKNDLSTTNLPVDHRSYNGVNYSIISKPKRV